MRSPSYRIYLSRSPWTLIVTWSFGFMVLLFVWAFFTTPDESRMALISPMLFLGFLTYLLDKRTLSWIRISENGQEATVVPSWFGRKLLGKRKVVVALRPGSELFFCRRLRFCIILRPPDGAEQLLWEEEGGISRRRCARIADELKSRFNLKTHLVRQTPPGRGPDLEWTQETDRTYSRAILKNIGMSIVPSLSPWFGIGARVLTANPLVIILIGVVLWVFGCFWFWYLYRSTRVTAAEGGVGTSILLWTFMFVPLFAATALATNSFIDR